MAEQLAGLGLVEEAWAACAAITTSPRRQALARARLLPRLPQGARSASARRLLEDIAEQQPSHEKALALAYAAAALDGPEREQVITEARACLEQAARGKQREALLAEISLRMAELGQVDAALHSARSILDNRLRVAALRDLAERLAALGDAPGCLAVVTGLESSAERSNLLQDLAEKYALFQQPAALRAAYGAALQISGEHRRALATAGLAAQAPPALRRELAGLERGLTSIWEDALPRSALLVEPTPAELAELLGIGLKQYSAEDRATVLANLLPHLAGSQRDTAWDAFRQAVEAIKQPGRRIQHLLRLLKAGPGASDSTGAHIPPLPLLQQAFETAARIDDPLERPRALSSVVLAAQGLPAEILLPGWQAALHQSSARTRASLLTDLLALLPLIEQHSPGLWGDAFQRFRKVCAWWP